MKAHRSGDGERILAVFIDFENVGLGFGGRRDRFNIEKVLERLVEKGKIVAKKAYADWSRFGSYASSLHSAAVELVEIPKRSQTGKNSADIRMCVDAMDLAYSKDHIDTFVIVSGDSDFSPLVSKLKELGKHVIGLGLQDSTSDLLRDNCDEFLYYEDLDRAPVAPLAIDIAAPEAKKKAFALLLDSLLALRRENKEVIYSSMVKDTMKRKKPSFNEEYHGYRTFSELLEDAQRYGLIELEKHKASGMYVVTRIGTEPKVSIPNPPIASKAPVPVAGNAARVSPAMPQLAPAQPAKPVRPPVSQPAAPASRSPRRSEEPAPVRAAPLDRPPVPEVTAEEEMPLGRALIEDIAEFADDEVPSYMPAKPKRPTGTGTNKPASSKPAADKAHRTPATPPASKKQPTSTPRSGTQSRTSKPASPPQKRAPQKPKATPKPIVEEKSPSTIEDSEFGAGIDV